MKTKNVILFLFVSFLLFSLCYLIGAFTMASFDISKWNIQQRGMVGVFGGIISLCIAGGITSMSYIENEK
jgi:hypothetical protein